MLKNYFLITLRNIRKNKVFSILNILGLAVGIASCLLILQYVSFESSFDKFHEKSDRIHRVDVKYIQQGEDQGQSAYNPYKLGGHILDNVPGIKTYSRTHLQYYGAVVTYEGSTERERRQFFEEDIKTYFVDQEFFEMFDFELLMGDRNSLLTNPNSIVITESMVEKYMPGVTDPVGKFLNVDGGWYPGTFQITGVLKDLPENTLFSFEFLLSISDVLKNEQYQNDDGWGWNNFNTYVLLEEGASYEQVSELCRNIVNDRNEEDYEVTNNRSDLKLMPLLDIHLEDNTENYTGGVRAETLTLFILIAVFIVGIAWLNYINLATAQALRRAKEVGIRKVIGAVKKQLIFQFMLEAFLINLFSLLLAFILAYISLPALNGFIEKELTFGVGIELINWIYFGLAFLLGTFLSGFYPSIVLSGFKPALVIKGMVSSGKQRFGLRQTLVIIQLIISVFLISGTMTVYKQLQFMRSQNLGMDVEQVLSMRGPRVFDDQEEMQNKMKAFQQKVRSLAAVVEVSGSDAIPGGDHNWGTSMIREGQDDSESQSVKMMWVDEHFHDTYGMRLAAGRFHSKDLRGDERQVIVNETLIKNFGFESNEAAIGQKMKVGEYDFPIIGVLEDFSWYSLKQENEPILLNYTEYGSNISVRLSTADIANTMEMIRSEYESFFPNNPFDYYFMDEYFDRQYKGDQQFGQIFTTFSFIAVVIACLGLFGLASFTLHLRIKEIGVRKVLGASLESILMLIYRDYLKLVAIASVIGVPLVYLATSKWLEDFATRISFSVDLILIPVMVLIVITLLTISYQSLKAATNNPTRSLRSE